MYKNLLENIDVEKVVSLEMVACCGECVKEECDCIDSYGNIPAIKIEMIDGNKYKHPLTDAFKVHQCNEFLRSMELMDEISFESYGLYAHLISLCNRLIPIRTLMKEITGKEFDEIGHTAEEIHTYILDNLLLKHRMKSETCMSFSDALESRPLKEWVAEALADLM